MIHYKSLFNNKTDLEDLKLIPVSETKFTAHIIVIIEFHICSRAVKAETLSDDVNWDLHHWLFSSTLQKLASGLILYPLPKNCRLWPSGDFLNLYLIDSHSVRSAAWIKRKRGIERVRQKIPVPWEMDKAKVMCVVAAINILLGISAILNRGLWVRFIPEEFVGWFMLAAGVVSYVWFFLHYLMVVLDRFRKESPILGVQ